VFSDRWVTECHISFTSNTRFDCMEMLMALISGVCNLGFRRIRTYQKTCRLKYIKL